MFYDETELCKKSRNYIIATVKVHIQNWNRFVLWDEKTIINKEKNRNGNF